MLKLFLLLFMFVSRHERSNEDGDCAYSPFSHAYLNLNEDYFTCYGELIRPYQSLENKNKTNPIPFNYCGWVVYAEIIKPYNRFEIPSSVSREEHRDRPHVVPSRNITYNCVDTAIARGKLTMHAVFCKL